MQFLLLTCFAAVASARPAYIAVPTDQIAFVDLSRVHVRVPRQVLQPPTLHPQSPPPVYTANYLVPPPQQLYNQENLPQGQLLDTGNQIHPAVITLQDQQRQQQQIGQQATDVIPVSKPRLVQRPPDFGEYVDFGAHSGDNGAFGWYADYPVNSEKDDSY